MELEIITLLSSELGGIDGFISQKPEGISLPAFVVECRQGRGESLYGNQGKPLGYDYELQVNILDSRYVAIRNKRELVIELLDGFTGLIGDLDVIDCRLSDTTLGMNLDKSYECVLFFTIKTK
ncbi:MULTISPECIES: hypothetical protein [unclassified Vibrio]|uniref:DUF3168 domain-containing protein n=1 Tax=Vibrio sp. HB236076 TaxID=3232307 RepID=A0AB39HDG2_9VIBR|nr:hypothetical protein [Vibrio sp. HB161653]MDP5253373.1 hypothetical protein [Vibrio sp. HB161653]